MSPVHEVRGLGGTAVGGGGDVTLCLRMIESDALADEQMLVHAGDVLSEALQAPARGLAAKVHFVA